MTCPPPQVFSICGRVRVLLKDQTHAKKPFYQKSDHWQDQGAGFLRQADDPLDLLWCRLHRLWSSRATGEGDVSDTERLTSPEEDNAKRKRLVADTMLDVAALNDLQGQH